MRLFRNRRHSKRMALVAALLSLGLVTAACGGGGGDTSPQSGGADKQLEIPYITWAEDVAVSYLWEHILEKRGYEVELRQVGAVGPIFNAIASGDVDLFFDMWLPFTHAQYKKEYGDKMVQLTRWFPNGATLEWAVPKYMEIDSITDLKNNPKLHDKLGGKIIGIGPGAGLTDASKKAINKVYNLKDYRLVTSSTPSMLAALESAIEEKKPIVVTLWRPHWAYAEFPIKDLKDPKGALGKGESIYAVAPTGWSDKYPKVAEWVSNFKLTPKQLFPLENMVVNKSDSAEERRQAAAKWASNHQDLIESWITGSQ